jgi:hypothetical protein
MSETTISLPQTTDLTVPEAPAHVAGRRRGVAAIALAAVAVGAFAVTAAVRSGSDPVPVPVRSATEADLLQSAEWARRLEVTSPELFAQEGHPPTAADLRLAAEWARRMASIAPDTTP